MSAPIFISYSSKDRKIAETLCQALEARGQACWIACRDVRGGENFQEAIVRALRDAKVMLLVFSANANNSDEIKKELVLAGRHHVTVVPARVEDVVPSDAFTYELATRQWVDLFQNWELEVEQLSAQLDYILQSAEPGAAPVAPRTPITAQRPSHTPLIAGLTLVIALLLAGGAVLFWKPWQKPEAQAPAAPVVAMKAAPPPAPAAVAQPAAAPTPAPVIKQAAAPSKPKQVAVAAPPAAAPVAPAPVAPVAAPPTPANSDDGAWQTAVGANSRASFAEYLRSYSGGVHAQEAQLHLANVILAAPATGTDFDGNWQTSWTCPNLGQYPGYSYQFISQVKGGVFHGLKGVKGEPSSLAIDGKIEADGLAAFSGEIIVGSSLAGMGAARGSASDYYALAQFQHGNGTGKRVEGRPCSLTFERQ